MLSAEAALARPWSTASVSRPAEGTRALPSPDLWRGPGRLRLLTRRGEHGAVMMCRPTSPRAMNPPDDTEMAPRALSSGPPGCLPQACACVAVVPSMHVVPGRRVPGAGVGDLLQGGEEKARFEEDGSAG